MSKWAYMCGAIEVDTFSKNALEEVNKFLVDAPVVTGSESDMEIFLNQSTNYNYWDGKEEHQTKVILTVCGDLRDKTANKTKKEFNKFTTALRQKFSIEKISVKIWGG